MHYMYGIADGNALEVRRLYEDRFSIRNIPNAQTFSSIHRRLCEKGSFQRNNHLKGVPRTVRIPDIEETILNSVDEDPGLSTRKIQNNLNISHILVSKILDDFLLHSYHISNGVRLYIATFHSG